MNYPPEIKLEILKFIIPPPLKLRPFFSANKSKLNQSKPKSPYCPEWCLNIPLTEKEKWSQISKDETKIDLIKQNMDKVSWFNLCQNPAAINIIEENLDKVCWYTLSKNPKAIHILEKNIDKIDWGSLSGNPNAIHLLEKNIDKIDWELLALNENALELIKANLSQFDSLALYRLNHNTNSQVIDLLIEKHPNKIIWHSIKENPGIFEKDFEAWKVVSNNILF